LGAQSGENRGTVIENIMETSDYKAIHQDEALHSGIHHMELKENIIRRGRPVS
jgi:hypothetical protein